MSSTAAALAPTDMLGRLAALPERSTLRRGSTTAILESNHPAFGAALESMDWVSGLGEEWELKVTLLQPVSEEEQRWIVLKQGNIYHACSGTNGWIICDRARRKVAAVLKSSPGNAAETLGRVLSSCK